MRAVAVMACLLLGTSVAVACEAPQQIEDTLRAYDPLQLTKTQRTRVARLTARALGEVAADHMHGRCEGGHGEAVAGLSVGIDGVLTTEQRAGLQARAARRSAALRANARELGAIVGQLRGWMPKPKPEPEDVGRRFDAMLETLRSAVKSWKKEDRLRRQVAQIQVAETEPEERWPDPREGLRENFLLESAQITLALKRAAKGKQHAVLRKRLAEALSLAKRLRRHGSFDMRKLGRALGRRARRLALSGGAMVLRFGGVDRDGRLVEDRVGLEYDLDRDIVSGRDRDAATLLYTLTRGSRILVLFENGHCGDRIVALHRDPS